MIRLANPYLLAIGLIFLPLLFKRKGTFLGYSQLSLLEEGGSRARFWNHLPESLMALAVVLMVLGFARPQWKSVVGQKSFLARDILLIMDLSNSMQDGFEGTTGPIKIDVSKSAAAQFVQKRENDRIGLLVFGDETFGSWPLTRDLKLILEKVDRLGSTFYGGTDLAKPLMKAMDHFREMGQSENRILVYLSDGQAVIPPHVKEEIIARLRRMSIHLYLVGIHLTKENRDLSEIVEAVEGRVIDVESSAELATAFEEIDRLEPSRIDVAVHGESQELYPGCVLSALGILFGLTVLRNILFVEL